MKVATTVNKLNDELKNLSSDLIEVKARQDGWCLVLSAYPKNDFLKMVFPSFHATINIEGQQGEVIEVNLENLHNALQQITQYKQNTFFSIHALLGKLKELAKT